MAIAKPIYSTLATLTVTGLAALANTASVTEGAEHDNTTDLFIDADVKVDLTAAAVTTGSVDVYALEGLATGALSSTAKTSNMRRLGSIELNGTTAVSKTLQLTDIKPFWKLHFINNSGAALSLATVSMRGINYQSV